MMSRLTADASARAQSRIDCCRRPEQGDTVRSSRSGGALAGV